MFFKEDVKTELKKSLASEEEILESVCAMVNAEGGTIYIGVEDSGSIVGIDLGKKTVENISNLIMRSITPPVYPKIKELVIEDKTVLSIEINKSEHRPHFYKGRAYKRVGKTNKILDPLNLELFFKQKFLDKRHFDSESAEVTIEEINEKSLKKFVKLIGKKYSNITLCLKNLGVIKEGKILNAALLFFGKEPANHFPLYGIKCAVFKNNELEDMEDFRGSIFEIVEPVMNYIISKIPKKLFFDKALRYEKPIIPEEVLREAIINALIHRDYTVTSSIFVKITNKDVEIKNPGMLPEPLEINDLYKPHESKPRNPFIAELAHKVKMIEHWGSGTLSMVSRMRSTGLADPVFSQERGFFQVILPLKEVSLNERQKRILESIKIEKEVRFSDLLTTFKVPERTLRRDVSSLIKLNMLYATKKGREMYYSLIK